MDVGAHKRLKNSRRSSARCVCPLRFGRSSAPAGAGGSRDNLAQAEADLGDRLSLFAGADSGAYAATSRTAAKLSRVATACRAHTTSSNASGSSELATPGCVWANRTVPRNCCVGSPPRCRAVRGERYWISHWKRQRDRANAIEGPAQGNAGLRAAWCDRPATRKPAANAANLTMRRNRTRQEPQIVDATGVIDGDRPRFTG